MASSGALKATDVVWSVMASGADAFVFVSPQGARLHYSD
jgi:hypothetical protein